MGKHNKQKGGNVAEKSHHTNTKPQQHNLSPIPNKPSTSSTLSELQQKFKAKLEGGRFRFINEKLYTSQSTDALKDFQADPTLFDVYHEGYRKQVTSWPVNPLDTIIQWVRRQGAGKVVADMGCGEARLARSVPNAVHSFDLVDSTASRLCTEGSKKVKVTPCDIAHVPLPPCSVDIAVFCLSLMGTNIMDFVREAHRILKPGGIIKIVEVRSRFHNIPGATTGTSASSGAVSKAAASAAKHAAAAAAADPTRGIRDFIAAIEEIGFDMEEGAAGGGGSGGGKKRHGRGKGKGGGGGGGDHDNTMFFFLEGQKRTAGTSSGAAENGSAAVGVSKHSSPHSTHRAGEQHQHQQKEGAKSSGGASGGSAGVADTFMAKPCLYKRR